MYCGMSFIIHNKEAYNTNKEALKTLIQNQNLNERLVCNASTIEYKDNLFLIIDGYSSLLEWMNPEEELEILKRIYEETLEDLEDLEDFDKENFEFTDTRFLHNFLLLTYPEYEHKQKEFYEIYEILTDDEYLHRLKNFLDENKHKKVDEIIEEGAEIIWERSLFVRPYLKRENICHGLHYYKYSTELCLMLNISEETPEEELKALADDIFKATSEKTDVNNVKFIETLYDCIEDEEE